MTLPIEYTEKFIDSPDAAFDSLWNELEWERRDLVPRREYYANDVQVPYTYGSGRGVRTYFPRTWHPVMRDMQAKLEVLTGATFEVCFLNGYENQRDALGPHADDSPEMDNERPIAIISLGVERDIAFAANDSPKDETRLRLANGSLCLMLPGMQLTHKHRIPKAGFDCGARISLTFRGYRAP